MIPPRCLPLFLVALALTACSGIGAPAPAVEAPDVAERALLLLLAERGIYEPFTVEKSLAGSADLRRFLAFALGWSGAPDGAPILEGLLLDDDLAVRRAAAFALGRVHAGEVADTLLQIAAGPDRPTAIAAVRAAAAHDVPLLDVLKALTPLSEEERWARLLPGLWRFNAPSAAAFAAQGLAAVGTEHRPAAAFALTERATPRELPAVRALVSDPDPRQRAWVARALARVGEPVDEAALIALLDDPHPLPVAAAFEALGAWQRSKHGGGGPALAARVARALGDQRPAVRWAALAAAPAWLPDVGVAAALAELAQAGSPWQRAAALEALAEGRSPLAGPLALSALDSPEPRLRAAAARAFAAFGASDRLAQLRRDPEPLVRSATFLAELERAGSDRRELLAQGLTDLDAGVRAALCDGLITHPALPFEALEASLALARSDGLAASRRMAVAALAARGKAEPLERGSVVRVLEKLAEDLDPLIRREAGAGLKLLDRPPVASSGLLGRMGPEAFRDVLWQTGAPRFFELATDRGTLLARLPCAEVPRTCLNFIQLAGQGAYDGVRIASLEPGRSLATGDRAGSPWTDPGYAVRDEPLPVMPRRGSLAMVTTGPDTAGSRLWIFLTDEPRLEAEVTIFGEILRGLDVLDLLEPGDRILSLREVAALRPPSRHLR